MSRVSLHNQEDCVIDKVVQTSRRPATKVTGGGPLEPTKLPIQTLVSKVWDCVQSRGDGGTLAAVENEDGVGDVRNGPIALSNFAAPVV